MKVGESSGEEVSWIPTAPLKPILPRTEPICADGEGNQLSRANFLNTSSCASPHATYTDSVVACAKSTAVAVSGLEGVSFADLLVLADAASIHFQGTDPGTNNEGTSSSASQKSTCCGKTISHLAPPTPDKAIRGESRQVVGMQVYVELEKNVPSTNNETPDNRELFEAVTESSLAAVSTPLKQNHNPDKGGSQVVDLNQTPTPKQSRKKHRPKVIKEGKPNSARKPVTPKPAQPKENPTLKFKYVRQKGLNKASTPPPTEVTVESTESIMPGSTKKSCRRSSNFELTEQPGGETTVPTENVTLHIVKGSGVLEETHTAPNTPLANINTPGDNSAKNWKRKGVVTTTQDGHEKSETQSSQNNSNSSKTGNLTTGLHMGGTKRKHSVTTDHADISHMNLIGVHYDGLHAYQRRCVQFPAVQKKRRSKKASASDNTSRTSLIPMKDLWFATYPNDLCASSSKCLVSCEYNPVENPITFEATDGATHDRSQAFQSLISLSQTRPTKRRSKAPTKFRDFATLTFTRNCSVLPNQYTRQRSNFYIQTLVDGERPINPLVAENMQASFKKKRSTRENRKKRAISTFASTTQMHHDFLLNGYQPSWDTANNMQKMEALTEKFRDLDINGEQIISLSRLSSSLSIFSS